MTSGYGESSIQSGLRQGIANERALFVILAAIVDTSGQGVSEMGSVKEAIDRGVDETNVGQIFRGVNSCIGHAALCSEKTYTARGLGERAAANFQVLTGTRHYAGTIVLEQSAEQPDRMDKLRILADVAAEQTELLRNQLSRLAVDNTTVQLASGFFNSLRSEALADRTAATAITDYAEFYLRTY